MVRHDAVDDRVVLAILLRKVRADLRVAALDLVVDGLADVVQKTRALCKLHVCADLRRHDAGKVRDLDRVPQHVLTVAGAVLHSAEVADELVMQTVYADLKHCGFARLADRLIDFLARLLDHLFDARGMDASVHDQLFKADARDLSAHRVERGQDDRLRRVVDDQIDAGRRFERADVASLAADDAALHFVIGQRHDGHGRFRDVVRCAALDRQRHDVARTLVGFFLGALLDLTQHDCRFVLRFLFGTVEHHGLCLVQRDAGNAFEFLLLLLVQGVDLVLQLIELLGTVVQLLLA